LARDIGSSHSQVRLALARAGVPTRSRGELGKLRGLARRDAVWLVEEDGITGATRRLEVSEQTFAVAVAALGISDAITAAAKTYDQRRRQAGPLWPPRLRDREAVAAQYTARPATTIASELDVSPSRVQGAAAPRPLHSAAVARVTTEDRHCQSTLALAAAGPRCTGPGVRGEVGQEDRPRARRQRRHRRRGPHAAWPRDPGSATSSPAASGS
jgi:hypothetical protein